jgi:hypothetical protein
MRRKARRLWAVAATVVGSARCAGTDTGNATKSLVSFDASDCKNGEPPPSGPKGSADGGIGGSADGGIGMSRSTLSSNEQDFFRLHCIDWELGDDSTLRINLWNVGDACSSATWAGASARFDGDTLDLKVHKTTCGFNACLGGCIFDFHFEIRDAPRGKNIPLTFDFTDESEKTCADGNYEKSPLFTFTIPASTEPSGTRCNPLVGLGEEDVPECFRHALCGADVEKYPVQNPHPCPVCPNGDVCGPIIDPNPDGYPHECLAPCATDSDCENPAMACRGGGCTVVATW